MTLNERIRRITWQLVFLPLFSLGHWQDGFLPLKGGIDYSCLSGSQVFWTFIVINQMSQFTSIPVILSFFLILKLHHKI